MTDSGKNFISDLYKEVCKLLQIKKINCTPYHPQRNGVIERFHRTLVDMVSHYVNKYATNWDQCLPLALMAYNRITHSSTGNSPYSLLYGREMRTLGIPDLQKYIRIQQQGDVKTLARKLKEAWTTAARETKKMQKKNKEYYYKKTKPKLFSVGDLVYLANPLLRRGQRRNFLKHLMNHIKF